MDQWAFAELVVKGDQWADSLGEGGTCQSFGNDKHPDIMSSPSDRLMELGSKGWDIVAVNDNDDGRYRRYLLRALESVMTRKG